MAMHMVLRPQLKPQHTKPGTQFEYTLQKRNIDTCDQQYNTIASRNKYLRVSKRELLND